MMVATQERVLYDLAGEDPARRFSPYCWRTRMALAHKGLPVKTVPWRFTDKEVIASTGQGRVPVLVDGETAVHDSWTIALYLEEQYPDRPSLFHGAAAMAVTRFVNSWADRVLMSLAATLIIVDIHDHLHEKDRAYFRASREKAFGKSLEDVMAGRDTRVVQFSSGAGAAAHHAARPTLHCRRHAGLRRLHPVRRPAMGARHQPVPVAGTHRSGLCLARPPAGRPWWPGPRHAGVLVR